MADGKLFIEDSRTSRRYEIPIHQNTVMAASFKQIKAPEDGSNPVHMVGDGLRLYDPGLKNTAVLKSGMTWVDGNRGLVLFRGLSSKEIWDCDYEDIAHLMLWGRVPSPEQKERLKNDLAIAAHEVPAAVVKTVRSFPSTAPAMTIVMAGLSAYLGSNPEMIPTATGETLYHRNMDLVDKAIIRTLAAYSVVVGLTVSHRAGRTFVPPDLNKSHLENFLIMMGYVDEITREPHPRSMSCLDRLMAMSPDQGLTNSTFSLLVTASSLADPISCIISALAAGSGPLHFGASEAAYKTMAEVGRPENVPQLIEDVKAGKKRLFGFGSATYKTVDPRITLIKGLLDELGEDCNPLLAVAAEIERIASTDEYFTSRKLHANADLYGVFLFIALKFSPEMIPIVMIHGRLPGMLAHWREAMGREIALLRPKLIYTGPTKAGQGSSKL
ncbi:putative citrate synthase [Cadophora sp. DSE1049]|nr:putative citrate synthase [Cadophora sp. DSE1049]